MDGRYYAGLDVGGTYGRVMLTREDGCVIGTYEGEGCAFNTVGEDAGRMMYRALISGAMERFETTPEMCIGICVAASGIDSLRLSEVCFEIFSGMGFRRDAIRVMNDCEIYLTCSPPPVMAAVVGTGSICYGMDADGCVFRTGGWNHILSDEGSAYDIGMKAIKCVALRLDGRGADTSLSSILAEKEGIVSLETADEYITRYAHDKSRIGKIARYCDFAAREGDSAAISILEGCADDFFQVVLGTYSKLGVIPAGHEVTLWMSGGVVLGCGRFYERLVHNIRRELPIVTVKRPEKSALLLAAEAATAG